MENELNNPDWDEEFVPLPFYPWDVRPHTTPLDLDECATAIHLANGSLPAAAELLRTPLVRLARKVRHTPKLALVLQEHLALAVLKAAAEPLHALYSPLSDDRRREWAATKILQSRAANTLNPFSPTPGPDPMTAAPPQAPTSPSSLSLTANGRSLTFRWRTDADDAKTIDHDPLDTPD
jgi:hypothetical protein